MTRTHIEARLIESKAEVKAIHEKALAEDRAFTDEENSRLEELKVMIDSYQRRLKGE